jgi:hypothetical protein
MAPGRHLGRTVHDIAVGALAGFFGGFVLGLFLLRLVDQIAVPFTIGVMSSVVAGAALERHGRGRRGITGWRVVVWCVLVLAVGFIALLVQAIDDFS